MLEIFKTNVPDTAEAEGIIILLQERFPHCKVNFDLQDCDKILRVKGDHIPVESIIELVTANGFRCSILE